ncbi:MAG: hypothetical protein HY532_06850 [Chloroflexi bacterium]|nr:hypothetical protein [Chloroflexota bacterium]
MEFSLLAVLVGTYLGISLFARQNTWRIKLLILVISIVVPAAFYLNW